MVTVSRCINVSNHESEPMFDIYVWLKEDGPFDECIAYSTGECIWQEVTKMLKDNIYKFEIVDHVKRMVKEVGFDVINVGING